MTNNASAKLTQIDFGVVNAKDVLRASHIEVRNRNHYHLGTQTPTAHGCLDRRMGTSSKTAACETCFKPLTDCLGHFGHLSLELPVFHIGYFRETVRILQCVCKTCARVLLPPEKQEKLLKVMRSPSLDYHRKKIIHEKQVIAECKKIRICPYCGAHNGTVKKLPAMFRLVHENRTKASIAARSDFLQEFDSAVKHNAELKEHINKAQEDLTPLQVLRLFKKISNTDCELLNFDYKCGRPEDLLVTDLAVPPLCIRPTVTTGGFSGSNEDELTIKLGDILYINQCIRKAFEKGEATSLIVEHWDFLQEQVAMYINSDLPGFPKQGNIKKIRALSQRLKGKMGRFRGNLSGKRVDFSSRTVISPDPNLRVDQVGVPRRVALVLTYPEKVSDHNIEVLRRAIINGAEDHPGANIIEFENGDRIWLKHIAQKSRRETMAKQLRKGDIVERHLRDGDVVLFNRQPSLHKMSIMAHKAKVLDWRTFRFNECVCTPYNADFDGDEMNLHLPQSEEAKAEALLLMGVEKNLVTSRHGRPLITATQDFLTSAYLLSSKDVFVDRSQFCHLCAYFSDANQRIDVPPPAIVKPMALWTGKQVFSALLRPNSSSTAQWAGLVNLTAKEINFSRKPELASCPWMCHKDGFVVIHNSELLSGGLGKKVLGGSDGGLVEVLLRDFNETAAASFLNRLSKLSARFIGERGFSIGIDDVTPSPALEELRQQKFQAGYDHCASAIKDWKAGKLESFAGMSDEETLESILVKELSDIRDDLGNRCLQELNFLHNSPLVMTMCGSKGSSLNISQMVVGVGQQSVSNQRIQDGFVHRTLPHFLPFSKDPEAKGFVENSFFSGLTATEFFFHTMGGREGLVDTAVKTAETGYMQRRLMKALEDLCVQYDGTVRTAEKAVVQLAYGDDGLDPTFMVGDGTPVKLQHMWDALRAANACTDEPPLTAAELLKITAAKIDKNKYKKHFSAPFMERLRTFLTEKAQEITDRMTQLQAAEPKLTDEVIASHISQTTRTTKTQLSKFLGTCRERYTRAVVEPGTAVGAVAAQSIGEPGTQMTLKTFHFAGVAKGMNITQGVPRIKEIINASRAISCPVISAPLEAPHSLVAARIVKGRTEKTLLGEVAEHVEEIFSANECYIAIKLDRAAIDALQLVVTADTVVQAILGDKTLKLKGGVTAKGEDLIRVYPPETSKQRLLFSLHSLRDKLPQVAVCGLKGVNRALIKMEGNEYCLDVEGENLLGVMTTHGVRGREATSNSICAVEETLGIEAARATIMREIHGTMTHHGLAVDPRHVALLADIMSYRGQILGITRFGISKMKDSVLMQASFEKTADHLFEAALRGRSDKIVGVSECIITGTPIPIGTGLFQLLHSASARKTPPKKSTRLLLSQFGQTESFT